jgi:hypothetical protein
MRFIFVKLADLKIFKKKLICCGHFGRRWHVVSQEVCLKWCIESGGLYDVIRVENFPPPFSPAPHCLTIYSPHDLKHTSLQKITRLLFIVFIIIHVISSQQENNVQNLTYSYEGSCWSGSIVLWILERDKDFSGTWLYTFFSTSYRAQWPVVLWRPDYLLRGVSFKHGTCSCLWGDMNKRTLGWLLHLSFKIFSGFIWILHTRSI